MGGGGGGGFTSAAVSHLIADRMNVMDKIKIVKSQNQQIFDLTNINKNLYTGFIGLFGFYCDRARFFMQISWGYALYIKY